MLALRKTLLAAALMPLALSAATVGDSVMINDGWMMCDAQIVRQKGREAGWRMQNAAREPREGKMLSSNDFKPEGWYKATVPGTVLTTLVNNGVYPEPLYGENNRPEIIPDSLCRRDWWYRTTVDIPSDFAGKTIWLNFEGINYSADVWVNGNRAGVLKGAFRRGHIDITPFVKAGEPASIAVCISPQPTPGEPNEHIMATIGGPCGGVGRLDGPTFGCSVGWDWMSGIRDRNAGIWQDVFLTATGPVEVKDPLITTDLPDLPSTDLAKISVHAVLKNNSDRTQTGTLRLHFAELDDNTPAGKRRFAVQVNGETVIPSIDVMEHTGRKHRSYVTEVKGLRTAADGRFDITFKNIKSGAPQISGYEIIPE